MTFSKRQWYKAFFVFGLFILGLLITGIVYPGLSIFYSSAESKSRQNKLKLLWLRWFGRAVALHIEQIGEPLQTSSLLVSNHISWLDICVIGQFTPAHFVAKSEIAHWPVVGFLAKQTGTVFVHRGNKQQAKIASERMAWLLKQQQPVCIFPEGTTTAGDRVLPFHTSLFQPVILTKAQVQPVSLEYLNVAGKLVPFIGEDAFISHLLKILTLPKIEVRIVFHPVIVSTEKTRQMLATKTWECIMSGLSFISEQENGDLLLTKNSAGQ